MVMDPLVRIKAARTQGTLPSKLCDLITKRFSLVVSGINRVETSSGLEYPVAYVEPAAVLSTTSQFGYGILFARTIPLLVKDDLRVVIQVSAPLVAYGLKGTIHAILAHEFLHYLDLMRRIKSGLLSDEITGNLFENVYADESRTLEPGAVFQDRTLVRHIKSRFGMGFRDTRLESHVVAKWIGKDLPRIGVSLDTNTVAFSPQILSQIRIPPHMADMLDKMYEKSQRIRSRHRMK